MFALPARRPPEVTGKIVWYGALGWIRKGDPEGVDFRDPWYATVSFIHRFSDVAAWGVDYDYRQKLTRYGDPVSEATLFVERSLGGPYKLQAYVLRGFADAKRNSCFTVMRS